MDGVSGAPWPQPRAWINRLRAYGLTVTVAPGWSDRRYEANAGYAGLETPVAAFVMHDTGTGVPAARLRNDHSLPWIMSGVKNRQGQPVRACHLYVARNGDVTCVFAYRTWHAGLGKAYPAWGTPEDGLNRYSIGMEIESQGGGVRDLTPAQIDAATKAAAATLDLLNLDVSRLINHRDYAAKQGKVDTAYPIDWWRARVRTARAEHVGNIPRLAAPWPGSTVLYGDRSAAVATIQAALGVTPVDGVYGPVTEEAVREWKRRHLLTGRNGRQVGRGAYRRLVRYGRARRRLS